MSKMTLARFKREVATMTMRHHYMPGWFTDGSGERRVSVHDRAPMNRMGYKDVERTAQVRSRDIILRDPEGRESHLTLGPADTWEFDDDGETLRIYMEDSDWVRDLGLDPRDAYMAYTYTLKN
jgi:hypothetical protein